MAPPNVVLSIAGDVDSADVKARVEAFFGDIPSGPPVERQQVRIAKRSGTQRQRIEDNVPQARVYNVWNVPQWGSAPSDYLSLVAGILGSGKTSRLYKRLVYDDQIATDVAAFVSARELGGQFIIQGTARPGVALAEGRTRSGRRAQQFHDAGTDSAGAAARADSGRSPVHPGYRADRRLRREVGHPRHERGLWRQLGAVPDETRAGS